KADGPKMRANPLPQTIVAERDEGRLHTLSAQIVEHRVTPEDGEPQQDRSRRIGVHETDHIETAQGSEDFEDDLGMAAGANEDKSAHVAIRKRGQRDGMSQTSSRFIENTSCNPKERSGRIIPDASSISHAVTISDSKETCLCSRIRNGR